ALAAAGLLTYAGSRMRAGRHLEPPLRREHPEPPLRREQPAPPSQPGSAPEPRARGGRAKYPPGPTARTVQSARRRPVAAVKAAEQLSFEDSPTEPDQRPS
ncbi:MAG TPA: hypothetical protein VMG80_08000, partial [Solirubrobacteraceae bacterium]|nr:hypothetical protein [Solirubrobacteraceae bacterium]